MWLCGEQVETPTTAVSRCWNSSQRSLNSTNSQLSALKTKKYNVLTRLLDPHLGNEEVDKKWLKLVLILIYSFFIKKCIKQPLILKLCEKMGLGETIHKTNSKKFTSPLPYFWFFDLSKLKKHFCFLVKIKPFFAYYLTLFMVDPKKSLLLSFQFFL